MLLGTRAFHQSQTDAMARLSEFIAGRQGQVATGRRWSAASEDPAAAQRSAALIRRQDDAARHLAALDFAESRLSLADAALGDFANRMTRVRELAVQAASDPSASGNRAILATEAREVLAVMVSLANAQDGSGNYLFAGARAAAPAFGFDAGGRVQFQGLGRAAPVTVGPAAVIEAAEPGPDLFGRVSDAAGTRTMFAVVEDFIAALEAPAPDPADPVAVAARRQELDRAVEASGAAIELLAASRAAFGGRLNRVEAERERLAIQGEALTLARSRIEDTDLAEAITELQRASLVLEATQRSFAQVSRLSLFNELR
jgi:flagellar hook-associated protein 3 FlgL